MNKKRIVVTGMGVVSCFGQDINTYYDKLLQGVSGVSAITRFPCDDFSTRFAAQVLDFDPGEYIDKKQARRVDPCIAYALVAGKKALEHAKLFPHLPKQINKKRCGVLIGSGMGGMGVFAEGVKTLLEKGNKRITPFLIPYILTNMSGALLAMDIEFTGPNYSVSTACATSNYAFVQAAQHIRNDEADLMIAGGVEAPILPIGLGGFCAVKALSSRNDDPERASRPWDKGRDGFVMGEGAGILVLESLEHAKKRGAPILAEYLGGALTCDAYHMTDPRPDGEGVAECVRLALRDAGICAEDINYINAHATSTPVGDMAEVNALKQIFKEPQRVVMNSTKSMIGHSLGAAGGQEAIATIMAICRSEVHPTINLSDPEDVGFHLPIKAEKHAIRAALSNSFGFGGHNASIILAPFKDFA